MKDNFKKLIVKNTVVATFLIISGLTISGLIISSLAIASPANAQTAMIAALYQNPAPQSDVRYQNTNTDINRNQIILAVNTSSEGIAIAENLLNKYSYDRIVTINQAQNLVCMVNGTGTVDGAVMCGFIDHE
jgi:hypothetical protein